MAGPCFVCGNRVAPFGYSLPGRHRDKPKGKRGSIWACSEHRPDGERRREDGIAELRGLAAPKSQSTPPPTSKEGPQK